MWTVPKLNVHTVNLICLFGSIWSLAYYSMIIPNYIYVIGFSNIVKPTKTQWIDLVPVPTYAVP